MSQGWNTNQYAGLQDFCKHIDFFLPMLLLVPWECCNNCNAMINCSSSKTTTNKQDHHDSEKFRIYQLYLVRFLINIISLHILSLQY